MKTSKSTLPDKSTNASPSVFQPKNQPFFKPAVVQPKLKIGRQNDKYEQQADRVADAVMRMPDPAVRQPMEEEELQMKQESSVTGNSFASQALSRNLLSRAGRGSLLPKAVQSGMGTKIGADFSRVNIHTDSEAVQMNQELGAKAFTHGRDIYFNEGQYNPSSPQGKHLLAHELTHVVQQQEYSGRAPELQREVGLIDKLKVKIGLGPSEQELLQKFSENATKASDLLEKADTTLKTANKLFKDHTKVRRMIQQASSGLEKIANPVNKIKKSAGIAKKAIRVLEFVDAVEDLDAIDVAKNPDKAAKAFDRLFSSAGEVYGILPTWVQNAAPQLKLLQSWGSFFENMTYGLHPSKRGGSWSTLKCSSQDIRDGKCGPLK